MLLHEVKLVESRNYQISRTQPTKYIIILLFTYMQQEKLILIFFCMGRTINRNYTIAILNQQNYSSNYHTKSNKIVIDKLLNLINKKKTEFQNFSFTKLIFYFRSIFVQTIRVQKAIDVMIGVMILHVNVLVDGMDQIVTKFHER